MSTWDTDTGPFGGKAHCGGPRALRTVFLKKLGSPARFSGGCCPLRDEEERDHDL